MKAVLFLLFSFASLAWGSVNGNWQGNVAWKYEGSGPQCFAQLAFRESTSEFSLLAGDLDCQVVDMSIPARNFAKSANGDLSMDGAIVGKWSANSYSWSERYNERTVINVTVDQEAGHLDYHEIWIQDQSVVLYDIAGRLFKSSN